MNPIGEIGGRIQRLDVGPNRLRADRSPALPNQPRREDLRPEPNAAAGFAQTARELIGEVDVAQKVADAQLTGLAAGEGTDVHQVTIAVEEAQLSVSLLIEILNRLV